MPKAKFPFPIKGLDEGRAVSEQPNLTSSNLNNVRPYDVIDNRARGGQRPGLDKWGDGDAIGSGNPVVAIVSVSYMETQ